ncbi:MAG: hypothetical protein U0235_04485 [Polyangiaceae bacterium]
MNRKQRRAQEAKTRQGAVLEAANKSAPMYDKIYAAEAKTASEMLGAGPSTARRSPTSSRTPSCSRARSTKR